MSIRAISGMTAGTMSVSGVEGAPAVQRPEEQARSRSLTPTKDGYIRSEKREPSGRYWLGKDEDGQPKVFFDDPEKRDEPSVVPGLERKDGGDQTERCVCSTDQVDREIEALKEGQAKLERQIASETDEIKIRELERKLARVGCELRRKDNDTYRRQHAVFS